MTDLALRTIGPNDFLVLDGGYPVGRIRLAAGRGGEIWLWNVTIPARGGGNGTSPGVDQAKAAFRASWLKFKGGPGTERLAAALEVAAATERMRR